MDLILRAHVNGVAQEKTVGRRNRERDDLDTENVKENSHMWRVRNYVQIPRIRFENQFARPPFSQNLPYPLGGWEEKMADAKFAAILIRPQ